MDVRGVGPRGGGFRPQTPDGLEWARTGWRVGPDGLGWARNGLSGPGPAGVGSGMGRIAAGGRIACQAEARHMT
ncbi:hypothetical protein GCM10010298_45180 [Streptomyces microflavus]|nr:hypothetical protein GCM10010298_45180 [Streptomyces microflavus]